MSSMSAETSCMGHGRTENNVAINFAEPVILPKAGVARQAATFPTGDSPSSTAVSPPAATPILFFTTSSTQFTTCDSVDITWEFSGPGESITLTVTNINVTQQDSSVFSGGVFNTFTDRDGDDDNDNDEQEHENNGGLGRRGVNGIPTGISTTSISSSPNPDGPPSLLSTLSTSVSPSAELFNWQQVYVPQGWYRIIATATNPQTEGYENFVANSASFFVSNGTDTSCLITSGDEVSKLVSTTSVSKTTSPTASATPNPSSSSSQVSPGTIGGAIAGGIAFVAIIILLVWWFLKTKSRTLKIFDSNNPSPTTLEPPERDLDGLLPNSGVVTAGDANVLQPDVGEQPREISTHPQSRNRSSFRPLPPIPVSFDRFHRSLQQTPSTSTRYTAGSRGYSESVVDTLPEYASTVNIPGSPPGYVLQRQPEQASSIGQEKWG
ncbi:hypothetical protein VKT23_017402 [Stygiomarasmius scandens]|uniref:Uncharacterized protein n=1 Tax=Marasmiellus scandens TaxID=2682957 RepID=A0ABR1ISB4_9AGAR